MLLLEVRHQSDMVFLKTLLFSKKLKLKLLPFSATKQYQKTFENEAWGRETKAIVRSYDVKTSAIILNKSKIV